MMEIRTGVAWASGLFEGEGCLFMDKRHYGSIRATLSSTDRDVVERFAAVVGVGRITPRPYPDPLKDQWTWTATGANAETVTRLLLPWFGERRTAKAHELLVARGHMMAMKTEPRNCEDCGDEFAPAFRVGPTARFCSQACRFRNYAHRRAA